MNLLTFKNRFKPSAFVPTNVYEVNGYMWALQDLLSYISLKTENNPAKRMVDAVGILESITATNDELMKLSLHAKEELSGAFKELAGVNLGSDKVNSFLNQDDLKGVIPMDEVSQEIENQLNQIT